jgi:hypothetical protein
MIHLLIKLIKIMNKYLIVFYNKKLQFNLIQLIKTQLMII